MLRAIRTPLLLLLATLLGSAAPASVPRAPLPRLLPPAAPDDDEDEGADGDDEEEAWLAVVGGDVHTGTGERLRGATVVAKDGVIEEIGRDPWYPEDATVIDATGLHVYPGLVAIETASGVLQVGGGAVEVGDDPHDPHVDHEIDPGHIAFANLKSVVLPPHLAAVEDSFDPFSRSLVLLLSTGITTTVSGSAVVKLRRGEIDGLVMGEDVFESQSWSHKNPSGKRSLREKLERASEYLREYRAWKKADGDEDDEPSDKGVDGGVLAVLQGSKRARFSVNDRTDLLSLANLAQEFDFRPVIEGCAEGWTVAAELGRAGATAILTPRDYDAKDEELVRPGGSTIENAAILHEHGVQVVVIPANTGISLGGIMGRDILALPIEAAFAVRGGLPEDAALASVTSVPARLLGVSHRIGTLEEGKDCDLFVADGDWLHYETLVQYTVVAGELVYDKQEEIYYASIRPRPEPEVVEEEPAAEGDAPDGGDEPAAAEPPEDGESEDGDEDEATDEDEDEDA